MSELATEFGPIDIYLFDQLLRGRVRPGQTILDAGCGGGRNLVYFLRQGYDVYAADRDPEAVAGVVELARKLAPELPESRFRAESMEALSFPSESVDIVVCNAVLHFAEDENQFGAMMRGSWNCLRRGGIYFARLASDIGIESRVRKRHGRWHTLPDGSDRFLVDEAFLLDWTQRLGGELVDPIKTTVVQGLRSMTTWVLRKSGA